MGSNRRSSTISRSSRKSSISASLSFMFECISVSYASNDWPDTIDNEEENARFPRMEAMSHFHYTTIDFGTHNVKVSLCQLEKDEVGTLDTGQSLLVEVASKDKSWVVKRSQEDFVGLDRQIHRCLYDRRYSELPELKDCDEGTQLDESMVQQMHFYLSRFSELTGNNLNCGPILNWLELDNHGNHLVVMEADDSAINVPAVAAGRVLKRYQAQAPDEMSLEVGDFLSIIDMPSTEETIWWRGKKGFEVGFFPSHCIEILGEKEINEQILNQLQARPVSKRRGKFINFLRFFFKSRPSKEELMQHGILRERVFGCDLGERLAHTGRDIPIVLEMCSDVVEEHGVCDGIYRLSGIVSNLQKLRVAFDCDDQPPNLREMKYLNDIHCISSLLKTYFRELPNPLFTYELYDKFVSAINKEDDTDRTVAFHHVIQRLPPPHYRSMNYLLRHLNFCASKADITNMTAKNLSIVWAPNLLRPNCDDSVAALTEFRTQAIIVEYMIRNVDVFFDKNLASAAIAYYPEMKESTPLDESECARMEPHNTGPKLITLEEARKRIQNQRVLTQTTSLNGLTNSPRHNKLKSSYVPPKVSACPVSPLPTLLSIEEAQARTKSKPESGQRAGSSEKYITVPVPDARPDISSVNSPRRSRKWFGLFHKSNKSNVTDDEHHSKTNVSYYTKKPSPLMSSQPTRSQSEYRLSDLQKRQSNEQQSLVRTESYSSTSSSIDRKGSLQTSLSSINAPVAQPEFELDTKLSDSDGDSTSLMSAIVSVRAKYMNLDDALRYHTPKRSLTIGSAAEFRKLKDSELNIEPPNAYIADTNTEHDIVTVPDSIIAIPYSSHRRGAPSIDSGYLSQGSTLNRVKDLDAAELPETNLSIERKQLRSNDRVTEEDVPNKKIRSLSPEIHVDKRTDTNKPLTHDDEKASVFRARSSSEASIMKSNRNSATITTPTKERYSPTIKSPSEYDKKFTSTPKIPFSDSADSETNNVEKKPTKPKVCEETIPERPSSLHLKRNYVNDPVLTTPSPSEYRNYVNDPVLTTPSPSEYRNSIIATASRNKIFNRLSSSKSFESPISPVNRKSMSLSSSSEVQSPLDRPFVVDNVFNNKSHELDVSLKSPTTKSDSLLKSVETNYLVDATQERAQTDFNSFTNSDEFVLKNSNPNGRKRNSLKLASSPLERGYVNRETDNKDVDYTFNRSPKSRDDFRQRRLSVREKAAKFGSLTPPTPGSNVENNTERPTSNPNPARSWRKSSENRTERTKSSPNLYSRNESKQPRRQKSHENEHSLYNTVLKNNNNNNPTSPSYTDFDLRCRVSDGLVNQYNQSTPKIDTSEKQRDGINKSRSTDRLVKSTFERRSPKMVDKTRPKSEVIHGFNFKSYTDEDFLESPSKQHVIKPSRSVHSVTRSGTNQPYFYAPHSLKSSKSDNRLAYENLDGAGKQIGSFPLTLKSGSAQNSRTSFDGDKTQKARPVSMYDNNRRSYYDNVNSIHYEML